MRFSRHNAESEDAPRMPCAAVSLSCKSRRRHVPVCGCRFHVADRGFSLSEVMVAATLSVFIMAGVLSAFLLITRTGLNASHYSELESQTRRGLELFAEDARQASNVHWNSNHSITFTVPIPSNTSALITYAYDSDPQSDTTGCFYRQLGDTSPRQVLVRQVASDFAFRRYKLEQSGIEDNTAANDLETKQIQLNMRAVRGGGAAAIATQAAISARFVLRNKRVSN